MVSQDVEDYGQDGFVTANVMTQSLVGGGLKSSV